MDLDSIEWDKPVYTLREFLQAFELPQIVCVRDGYFDLEEITTLSTDQVMTIHYVKTSQMLNGLSELKPDEQLSIPITTKGTFQLLSDKLPKMYKSVKALKNDSGKMVLSLHNHAWLGIHEKDVLKIKGLKKRNGKEYLRCSLVNREGDDVELPLSYEACFQSYEEPERVEITDIEKHCMFPCTVKMHGRSPIKANIDERSESLDLSTLGKIKVLGVYEHVTLITSVRDRDKVSVNQVPVDLEITVVAAKGAKQKDSKYQTLCREIHNNTQFQQMDGLYLDYVKMGNDQKSVDNIYDYIDLRYLELSKRSNTPPSPEKTTNKPVLPPKPRTASTNSDNHGQIQSPTKTTQGNDNFNDSKITDNLEVQTVAAKTTNERVIPPKPQRNCSASTERAPADTKQELETVTDFKIPDNLEKLTVDEVAECLRYLHMDTYVEKFQEELIDGAMLVELSEEMMRESLGVTNKLHQKKLKMLVQGWRPK